MWPNQWRGVPKAPRKYPNKLADDLKEPGGAGLMLAAARLAPAANEVFTPDELEQRIARYRELAAARVPIFGGTTRREASDRSEIECWACGLIVPRTGAIALKPESELGRAGRAKRKRLAALNGGEPRRWASRPLPECSQNETYCPKCFEIWGWPDELAAIVEAVEGVAAILTGEAEK